MPRMGKLALKIILIVLVAAVLAGGGFAVYAYWLEQQVDTDALLQQALDQTKSAQSYRFFAQSVLLLDNQKTAESVISGEKDDTGNLHAWGEMMDSAFEIYQIGLTHYRYNGADGRWIVQYDSPIPDNALLLMEINPLINFQGDVLQNSTFLGRERIGRHKYYKYTLLPGTFDHIAGAYYNNFVYTLWIDKEIPSVYRAEISCRSINNPESRLVVLFDLYDLNEKIEINTSPL